MKARGFGFTHRRQGSFGMQGVAHSPGRSYKRGPDVSGDACHVLTLGSNGKGSKGISEREYETAVHYSKP